MPDPVNPPAGGSDDDNKKVGKSQTDDQQQAAESQPVSKPKEQEPQHAQEADILKEIQERDKEASDAAQKELKESIGKEAKLREPEPKIPPDVKDAGVKSPDAEASKTIKEGGKIELPSTEQQYEEGQHTKVKAKVTQKREVYGVKSIVALALLVGKMVKLATHHGKKFVFRKKGK